MTRSRSGGALQPHWRWQSVAYLAVGSAFGILFALLWVQAVGGIGLGKALAGGLLVAWYAAGCRFLYDFIWWRGQRWRLLVVADVAWFGVFMLVAGLLTGQYSGPMQGWRWVGLAALFGLAVGPLLTLTWWLRKDRLRAESWHW